MRLIIDIDGTICEERPTFERALAKPLPDAVEVLKRLKLVGHHITLYTARGWREYEMTEAWLNEYEIPFDMLICGKPVYDIWVDDRAMKFTNWREVYGEIVSDR